MNARLQKKESLTDQDLLNIEQAFAKQTPIPVILKDYASKTSDFYLLKLKNEFDKKNFIQSKKDRFISQLQEQKKLTDSLKEQILASENEHELNDLFRPFRSKKTNSKVELAKNQGLEDFAKTLLSSESLDKPLDAYITELLNAEKGLTKSDHVLSGLRVLIEDHFMNSFALRKLIRDTFMKTANLVISEGTNKKDENQNNPFASFIGLNEPYKSLSPAKYFHIRRGERHKFLNVEFKIDEETLLNQIFEQFITQKEPSTQFQMQSVLSDLYHQKLKDIIIADLKQDLWNKSQDIFLPQLNSDLFSQLMQPVASDNTVLAVYVSQNGPSGLALVKNGQLLKSKSLDIIEETKTDFFGTIQDWLKETPFQTVVVQHQKQAAAVYDQLAQFFEDKKLGLNVFPLHAYESNQYAELAGVKQAHNISAPELIAFYLGQKYLDPLKALVQFDLTQLALGQIQKEIDPEKLRHQLTQVASFAVCREKLNINTASPYELSYIPGITLEMAEAIVEKRNSKPFDSLDTLKEISGFSDELFELAQSFLRLNDNDFKSSRRNRFVIRKNHVNLKDLKPGAKLVGSIQNFAPYGVFIHIGCFQDLLVHKNNMPETISQNFAKALHLGQKVDLEVLELNADGLPQLKLLERGARPQGQKRSFQNKSDSSKKHKKGLPHKKSKPRRSEFGTLADQFAKLTNN